MRQDIKDEIVYLKDLLYGNLKENVRDLIGDIIYGYLCELYDVQEEDCEECEDEEAANEALRPPQESSIQTIHVSNLQDLLQALRERE